MEAPQSFLVVEKVLVTATPRVLFVGAFPAPDSNVIGGMVTSCRALLASSFPERVDLVLLDSTQPSNPPPPFLSRLVRAAARFGRFLRAVRTSRPDVVLLFVSSGASVVEKGAMAAYSRRRGVPVMMFPRAGAVVDAAEASRVTQFLVRRSFGNARRLVCQSEAWRRFAIERLEFSRDDVILMRNWTASDELLSIGARRDSGSTTAPRLIFVGWLERGKGVLELIEACRELSPRYNFSLDLIGDGRIADDARALIGRYQLEGRVRLRGWLPEAEVRNALAHSDVFVLPSHAEGLPNAMVEAMAAKLAIVVSNVGAIPDVVVHRTNGLLVPPRNVSMLAAALQEVIVDGTLRQSLARRAFETAKEQFGAETAAKKLAEHIENVVAESCVE